MKTMRAILPIVFLTALTACSTFTPTQREALADAAEFVKTTADGVASLAINNSAGNRDLVALSTTALNQLLLAKTHDPAAVEAVPKPIWAKADDPVVAFGLRTGLNSYRVAIRRWVRGQIDRSEVAKTLLVALRDGGGRWQQALTFPAAARPQT